MKTNEVQIGNVYMSRVTDKLVPVRIEAENRHGGWDATNLATGKKVRIKSPQKLRGEAKEADIAAATNAPAKATAPKAATAPTADTGGKTTDPAKEDSKPAKAAIPPERGETKAKKPSGLDAAARVLAESNEPMNCREIVQVAFDKGYWHSEGATPHATVYSAMIREISAKGDDARFQKVARGKFAANG